MCWTIFGLIDGYFYHWGNFVFERELKKLVIVLDGEKNGMKI
jgi:hypothetical protein